MPGSLRGGVRIDSMSASHETSSRRLTPTTAASHTMRLGQPVIQWKAPTARAPGMRKYATFERARPATQMTAVTTRDIVHGELAGRVRRCTARAAVRYATLMMNASGDAIDVTNSPVGSSASAAIDHASAPGRRRSASHVSKNAEAKHATRLRYRLSTIVSRRPRAAQIATTWGTYGAGLYRTVFGKSPNMRACIAADPNRTE